jgi:glucokinase
MRVLAGDIGGTKTLLAIAEVSGQAGAVQVAVIARRRYESHKFPGLAAVCQEFAAEVGPLPRHAGFGVAGPVSNGRSQATNLAWVLDQADLARTLQLDSVRLANDFGTLALGIPALKPDDLTTVNEGVRVADGPIAVIGAGTGLGECVAMRGADHTMHVFPSEGGHTDFAPRNELEISVLRFLFSRWEHVSWERLLSGEGLVNLAQIHGAVLPPLVAQAARDDRKSAPAAVTDAAAAGDPICRQALQLFTSLYGSEAGNLALKTLPTGGLYVGGGIAPRILDSLRDGRFREAFLAKGRMRALLEQIPVQIILNTDVGLLGAASLAAASPP